MVVFVVYTCIVVYTCMQKVCVHTHACKSLDVRVLTLKPLPDLVSRRTSVQGEPGTLAVPRCDQHELG